jgi:hypothetical protein
MNSDIRIPLTFFEDGKTVRLVNRLGHEGIRSSEMRWRHAAQARFTGLPTRMDRVGIVVVGDWRGEQDFVQPLLDEGWLEQTSDGTFRLHAWEEHQRCAAKAPDRKALAQRAAAIRWQARRDGPKAAEAAHPQGETGPQRRRPRRGGQCLPHKDGHWHGSPRGAPLPGRPRRQGRHARKPPGSRRAAPVAALMREALPSSLSLAFSRSHS